MTIGDGLRRSLRRSTSPVHLHVQEETPVHVHIQRPTAKAVNADAPAARSGSSNSVRPGSHRRVKSPAPHGPWIPPPGRTSKGLRNGDLWEPDEVEHAQAEQYEKKIDSLLSDVQQLKAQREVERKEELLDVSRQIMRDQEMEIAEVKHELGAFEKENDFLRRSLDRLHGAGSPDICRDLNVVDEALGRKLVELELESDHLLRLLHNYTDLTKTVIREGRRVNGKDINNISKTRDCLYEKIDEFELANRGLRRLLRERHEAEGDRMRAVEQRDLLLKKVAEFEELNKRLQIDTLEKDRSITELRDRINDQRDENISFANQHQSLEQTRAHLQKQLRQKEADCNRMAVQMRTLEGQLAQEKIENEHLSDLLRQAREKTERDKEQLKRATRAQKQRAARSEDAVEQLTAQIMEKDNTISELQLRLEGLTGGPKGLPCRGNPESDLELVQTRVEKLTREKAHTVSEANQLRDRVSDLHDQVSNSKEQARAELEAHKTRYNEKLDEANSGMRESERLRSRVKALEEKLAEAETETTALRNSLRHYENLLNEYRTQAETQSSKLNSVYEKLQHVEDENKRLAAVSEESERRFKESESLNRELSTSLAKREDSAQANQARLEEKSRENNALMRQLEVAMAEARRHSEASRDQQNVRERQLQSRVLELDSQLMQTRAEMAKLRRERDEGDRRFNSRLHDLKDRLEQSESSNRSLQNYIRFLKNSYANTFGEPGIGRGGRISPFVS